MGLLDKADAEKKSQSPGLSPVSSGSGFPTPARRESDPPKSLLKRAEDYRQSSGQDLRPDLPSIGLLKKAEKILEAESTYQNELEELDTDLDEFSEWEKEAKEHSQKTPIQPSGNDGVPENKDYLFDDESDFTTQPIEYHLASKKKIENYQSIFEIAKEIAASSNFDDYFANLNYSILGQVGPETLAVFSSIQGDFASIDLLEYHGFEPTGAWTFEEKDYLYQRMRGLDSVIYAGEILSEAIPEWERKILESINAEVLVPMKFAGNFYGFIVLGQLISGEEYIVDDLEFVKVMADIASSVYSRVSEFEARAKELAHLQTVIQANNTVMTVARDMAKVRKLDTAYDILVEAMRSNFGVQKFSFLVFDPVIKDEYKVFSSNQLTPQSIESFRLGRNSDLVGMISNVMAVYRLENFHTNPELMSLLPNDEIGIMEDFTLIPLINLNWLVGIFIVHKTSKKWTNEDRDIIVNLFESISPVFANIMILEEKENSFRNPFSPIEDRLNAELAKSVSLKTVFTLVVFKVQNISRMIQIMGQGYFAEYCDLLRKSIQNHLGENDHYVRVGQGKFAVIFHSKDKGDSEIVIKKIKAEFQDSLPESRSAFKPSYRILSLEYPKDTKLKEQFLEMIEEA
jgi:GGDEF domain-containing protein